MYLILYFLTSIIPSGDYGIHCRDVIIHKIYKPKNRLTCSISLICDFVILFTKNIYRETQNLMVNILILTYTMQVHNKVKIMEQEDDITAILT